jgi:hypothetical protein
VERVKTERGLLMLIMCVAPLWADTCLAPKNPVPAALVCGRVRDQAGDPIANAALQVVNAEGVTVAEARADAKGNFVFDPLPKGEYNLTTKMEGWHLFWPVEITSSKPRKACNLPLEVTLGIKVCGAEVSKKGYHARF